MSVGAGALIGYYADSFFGTGWIFLVIFVIAGFAAGVLNMVRITKKYKR